MWEMLCFRQILAYGSQQGLILEKKKAFRIEDQAIGTIT